MIATAPLFPQHTALLMIGAERYIARRPVGPLPTLEEAAALLRDARRGGAHVVHVRRVPEGAPRREARRCRPASDRRGTSLAAGEALIETCAASPFADTPLHEELIARGVEAVIVAGVLTPTSCAATANEALARRYRTIVAAGLVPEHVRESKRRLGAEVLSSASIRGLLTEGPRDAPRLGAAA